MVQSPRQVNQNDTVYNLYPTDSRRFFLAGIGPILLHGRSINNHMNKQTEAADCSCGHSCHCGNVCQEVADIVSETTCGCNLCDCITQ